MNQIQNQTTEIMKEILKNMGTPINIRAEEIIKKIENAVQKWVEIRDEKIAKFLIPQLTPITDRYCEGNEKHYTHVAKEYAEAVTASLQFQNNEAIMVRRFERIVEKYALIVLFKYVEKNIPSQLE